MQGRKQRGGGVAPRQNSRIRHQGEQRSEKKNEEGDIQEANGKQLNEKTKLKGRGKRRTARGKGKTKKKRKKEKARVSGRHYANYLGLTGGAAS